MVTIRTLLLSLLLFSIDFVAGQAVVFHEPQALLGTIIDNQGVVSHQFSFINKSSDSIQVERVATSCGCTSSQWTAEVLDPGATGFVELQLDPYNRPGPFERYAYVHFKGMQDSVVLQINGFIKPGTESVEEAFPIKMGDLRVKQTLLDLGTLTNRKLFSKSFEMYNDGDQILVFADDMEGPNHITVTFEPYTLRPKSKGKIWVHYDVNAKNDLGFFQEQISISTYESTGNRKNFTVSSTILDLPSGKSRESPKVHFNHKELDFGIKKQGDTVKVSYVVNNTGRSSLQLKKVFGNCNCIRVRPEKYKLNPGESANIEVTFLTTDRLGNQEKIVTVFTDDPSMPVAILKLKGRLRGPRN